MGWAASLAHLAHSSPYLMLVFESPVRSGLLPSRAWTETETGLRNLRKCKKPDRTAKDRSKGVGLGLSAVTRPVLTGYGLNRFRTGLDRSSGVSCEEFMAMK
jgi:hypothetical protein